MWVWMLAGTFWGLFAMSVAWLVRRRRGSSPLRGALAAILLMDSASEDTLRHLQAFLKARDTLAPALPVQVLLSADGPGNGESKPGADPATIGKTLGVLASDVSSGQIRDQTLRLTLLDRLLQQARAVD